MAESGGEAGPRAEVVLTDPRALRALAHPARTAIIDELFQGNVRTASELAGIVGLTPSATSYHLRALERWGILVRAEGGDDGRERPWRAAARRLRWNEEDLSSEAQRVTRDAIAGEYLQRLREQLDAWARAGEQERAAWRETAHVDRGYLWLSAEEARDLRREYQALLERYSAGRDAVEHPAGSRRFAIFHALTPVVEA